MCFSTEFNHLLKFEQRYGEINICNTENTSRKKGLKKIIWYKKNYKEISYFLSKDHPLVITLIDKRTGATVSQIVIRKNESVLHPLTLEERIYTIDNYD